MIVCMPQQLNVLKQNSWTVRSFACCSSQTCRLLTHWYEKRPLIFLPDRLWEKEQQGAHQPVMPNWLKARPVLRNRMTLFVPQRRMQGLGWVPQGQDTGTDAGWLMSWFLREHSFPRGVWPALWLAFGSLAGLLLHPSAYPCQILSEPSFAWWAA